MKRLLIVIIIASSLHLLSLPIHAQVKKVEAIGFTVRDMDRSVRFYSEVLHFKKISDTESAGTEYEKLYGVFGLRIRVVQMQLGDETIELTDYLTSGGRTIPEDQQSNDLIFQHIAIVVSDMEKAYQHLRRFTIDHVSTAPQTLPKSIPAAEGIKAFYFRDPDQHNLELIYFPKGKGLDKWQQPSGKIFLGIDHTAIGIGNTERSHQFYQQLLGLERKGDSWNKGSEQEHLNNIKGASLHITGYRSNAGPGIEFLEYLSPGPGKPYPADSKASDLWHWQTSLIVSDASSLLAKLKQAAYHIISDDIVTMTSEKGRKTKSFLVRDPDGHAVLIKEEE
jgi:catechol 2,3-dioxygenase-like lactoylglutathione lyase family enzyme